ncbi:MAG: DNA methyltransferase [Phycisphaerales bacterium JB054]
MYQTKAIHLERLYRVRQAALDQSPVTGLTHTFYRYPARFSPVFPRAAIEAFSEPGQVVLDPYMGGGTTVLEAMVAGRKAVGADLNSLARFVTRVKTTPLNQRERAEIAHWAESAVQQVKYGDSLEHTLDPRLSDIPKNMTLPAARPLRKAIALCIAAAEAELPTAASRRFARCVVLNVGQWALNGRRRIPTISDLRARVAQTTRQMLDGVVELQAAMRVPKRDGLAVRPVLVECDAAQIDRTAVTKHGLIDLVVTSPPYPGIHMLYHRWQVDGRKETDAPYWIAACNDGQGASYYNFADRRRQAEDRYFAKATETFRATRTVMREGAIMVQMIAFSDPDRQLQRYLRVMDSVGFSEFRDKHERRTYRNVPSRSWHATSKGSLPSAREVVLVHRAV